MPPPNGVDLNLIVNLHYVVAPAGFTFAGVAGANVTSVWLKVLRRSEDFSTVVPTVALGWVEVATIPGGPFGAANIPGAIPTELVGNPDNKVAAIPVTAAGFGDRSGVNFRARPRRDNAAVLARHCIWFAFAATGLEGPAADLGDPGTDFEFDTAHHIPPAIIVPENVTRATFNAAGRLWRHGPVDALDSCSSDADGRVGVLCQLERAGYKHATYGSLAITDQQFNVGKLIGMLVDGANAPITEVVVVPGQPAGAEALFPIGTLRAGKDIPGTAARLYLAYHDGKRWHNNSGSMSVDIDWDTTVLMRHERLVVQ